MRYNKFLANFLAVVLGVLAMAFVIIMGFTSCQERRPEPPVITVRLGGFRAENPVLGPILWR